MGSKNLHLHALRVGLPIPYSRPLKTNHKTGAKTHTKNPIILYLKELCKKRIYTLMPQCAIYDENCKDLAEIKKAFMVKGLTVDALKIFFGCESSIEYFQGKHGASDMKFARDHLQEVLQLMHFSEDSDEAKKALSTPFLETWQNFIIYQQAAKEAARGK